MRFSQDDQFTKTFFGPGSGRGKAKFFLSVFVVNLKMQNTFARNFLTFYRICFCAFSDYFVLIKHWYKN